jgi:hypothetical protein
MPGTYRYKRNMLVAARAIDFAALLQRKKKEGVFGRRRVICKVNNLLLRLYLNRPTPPPTPNIEFVFKKTLTSE